MNRASCFEHFSALNIKAGLQDQLVPQGALWPCWAMGSEGEQGQANWGDTCGLCVCGGGESRGAATLSHLG